MKTTKKITNRKDKFVGINIQKDQIKTWSNQDLIIPTPSAPYNLKKLIK